MRQFGKIKLNNRDYEQVIRKYIQFYETENKCTEWCPLKIKNNSHLRDIAMEKGYCFCNALPMFPEDLCPCNAMGEKAFIALEEFIKEYGKEFV